MIGKKRTKEKGPLIVEMLGKRIKLEPVEQMCSDVRERGLNTTDIQRLKRLYLNGQRSAFEMALSQYFGTQYLPIFEKYKNDIKEQEKEPLPNSKYLYTK